MLLLHFKVSVILMTMLIVAIMICWRNKLDFIIGFYAVFLYWILCSFPQNFSIWFTIIQSRSVHVRILNLLWLIFMMVLHLAGVCIFLATMLSFITFAIMHIVYRCRFRLRCSILHFLIIVAFLKGTTETYHKRYELKRITL